MADAAGMTKPCTPSSIAAQSQTMRATLAGVAVAFLFCCGLLWSAGSVHAAEPAASLEDRVKAAYLYKFAAYVEWPAGAFPGKGAPFRIAVIGAAALADELDRLVVGRTINDRPVEVIRPAPDASLAGVHMLFIGRRAREQIPRLTRIARQHSILTVTESEGALADGSVINFVIIDRRVRFEIGLAAARASGLKLSSRLLAVAESVYREGQ